jgi:hypothetical protein
MDNIIDPNNEFDFSQLSLGNPTSIQGGAYFTKLSYFQKPLYIQTPKSLTKQGFVKNAKKYYTELMFDNNDEKFFHWLENLESKCYQLIYEKRDTWFQNQLELNDIEGAFATTIRPYKSCKYYLLRVNVKMNYATNMPLLKIYNENETPLTIDDVTSDTNIISIVEIQGIKFTPRSFQIDIELKQMMTMNTEILFENCLIKTTHPLKNNIQPPEFINTSLDRAESLSVAKGTGEKLNSEGFSQRRLEQEPEQEQEQEKDNISVIKETKNVENKKELEQMTEPILKEELNISEPLPLENADELKEVDFMDVSTLESITLKKPNQVYYEIYKAAIKKARTAKKEAIIAFLEAKNIKKTYMLENLDESDSDQDMDLDNLSEYSDGELDTELER